MYEVAKGSITLANNDWNVSFLVVLREAELCVVMIVTIPFVRIFSIYRVRLKEQQEERDEL
jgi:hypothetical protein